MKTARRTETPNAQLDSLATPSLGSKELSTWRVTMQPGAQGPVHIIDREQVWMPLSGSLEFIVDGEGTVAGPGQAVILPAGVVRQVKVADGPAEAMVCMAVGGHALAPGNDERHPLPWAE
ncbi:quercetin dioxygenase-like cupin family protein [Kibdelosporangium banguiense]|uniref:Quercetin dioxygenase-like cupin family protein n=1 Tax=Kibdelosporangium banguiense TaxID=1365924 RepID=A0ABS4TM00_9PSEU|nr:cupin domain-containing protein [Kibdelosporangium banguiense]MBP2325425.1 quercetin dioxygenase-like cupin family protein [Kibdelosporangium banguiense]